MPANKYQARRLVGNMAVIRFALVLSVIALLLSSGFPSNVRAAAGDLDPTFGNGGVAFIDFNLRSDRATALTLQPDGKIILVGSSTPFLGLEADFAVARFNPDGCTDSSFGANGLVLTDFGGDDVATGVALQPDGKIVVGGTIIKTDSFTADFVLVRYNPDGSLDNSFGTAGRVQTDFTGRADRLFSIAIQPDGKIIAVGSSTVEFSGGFDFALARYNADGSLDPLFGDEGKVITDLTPCGGCQITVDILNSLAIDSQGRIIVAGTSDTPSTVFDMAVGRYNPDGSVDSSFGNGGFVVIDFGSSDEFATSVLIQADGKIVAGGRLFDSVSRSDFALVRLNADGSLDPSFGSDGKVITDYFGRSDVIRSLAVQTDGKIIAAGIAFPEEGSFGLAALARYLTNGTLDPTFGNGGKVTIGLSNFWDTTATDVALQPDGKIVLAAEAFRLGTIQDFTLLRYKGDGLAFDVCLQDDSGGNTLKLNTATGEYQFTSCSGFTVRGSGNLMTRGCTITLQDTRSDRRVLAKIDTCQNKATGSIQVFSQGMTMTISDRNTTNNSCSCNL